MSGRALGVAGRAADGTWRSGGRGRLHTRTRVHKSQNKILFKTNKNPLNLANLSARSTKKRHSRSVGDKILFCRLTLMLDFGRPG
jgi:hypothetical protein